MPLIISENDKREYRLITLNNELEVMLIHDVDADKGGASMDVRSGSWKDPSTTEGLAHFCEHMLFLGTKKYPEENAYLSFLNSHSGTYNAYTANESTNYMFEVAAEYLEETLDLFAQFFIEPLFTESGTAREVEAIQSEHSKNLQSDLWRTQRLNEVLASKEHPMSKFGTGTLKTLQVHPDLRDQVMKFWKTHYSANIMKLVILGKESLDDLERIAKEKFSAIENKHYQQVKVTAKPYGHESLATRLSAIPVSEIRKLTMAWPSIPLDKHFRSKPDHYISHLLGHEAEGSILSYLKSKGWAEGLTAGGRSYDDHSLFQVTVDLTHEGVDRVYDIVNVIYAYIALLKDHGIREELFEELKILGDLSFRFKDKEDPFHFVTSLSTSMQTYPSDYVLVGSRIMDQFDPETIKLVLNDLTPQNMLIGVYSDSFKNGTRKTEGSVAGSEAAPQAETASPFAPNLVEEHYGIEYRIDKLDQGLLDGWQKILSSSVAAIHGSYEGLEMPKVNPFMPDDLTILEKPAGKAADAPPELILDTPTIRVWHKQDQTYLRPRASLSLDFNAAISYYSPLSVVKTKLFVEYLQEELNEFSYDAAIAGLKYSVVATIEGFSLIVSGYNCKQYMLLEKLITRFNKLDIQPERFEMLRGRCMRMYKNQDYVAAYASASYQYALHMEQPRWNVKQYATALEDVTPQDLREWIPQLLTTLYVEILSIGNVNEEHSKKVAQLVTSTLHPKPFLPGQFVQFRTVALPHNRQCWIQHPAANPEETNSAIFNYFQIGPKAPRLSSLVELLVQIVAPLTFDTLRTKEQLGYIVATAPKTTSGIEGVLFIVQSMKMHPVDLDARVEAFLASVEEQLRNLPKEEFEQNRDSLILQKREKFTSLKKETAQYWEAISSPHTYDFNAPELEAVELEKMTLEDVIQCWTTYFAPTAPQRAKLSVQVWPSSHKPFVPADNAGAPIEVITDPFLFKGRMPLHGVLPVGIERVTVSNSKKE